jgi:hypothetical protein
VLLLLFNTPAAPGDVTGTGSVTFAVAAISGTGTLTFTGTGAVAFAVPAISGSDGGTVTGSGAVAFAVAAIAGRGLVGKRPRPHVEPLHRTAGPRFMHPAAMRRGRHATQRAYRSQTGTV